jgi:hypothetical protein
MTIAPSSAAPPAAGLLASLQTAADIDHAAWADDFEWAQDPDLHGGNGCTHEAPTASNLWPLHEALTAA